MSSVEDAFEDGPAFIPFTVAGYPTKEKSAEIVETVVENGADIVELGVPFSDPIADGPTIKEADQEALENGFDVEETFEIASGFRDTPVVLLCYANILHSYGYENFFRDAEEAGVDGLIVPDMPPEEFREEAGDVDTEIDRIFLIAQNTPEERIEKIGEASEGFAYLVSVKGITGAREDFSRRSRELVEKTQNLGIPRCIGFGISSPEHARIAMEAGADGVIVGSALIDEYSENGIEGLENLTSEIAGAVEEER